MTIVYTNSLIFLAIRNANIKCMNYYECAIFTKFKFYENILLIFNIYKKNQSFVHTSIIYT